MPMPRLTSCKCLNYDRVRLLMSYLFRTTSYEYSLLYVRSLPPSSQAGQAAAVEAITVALRIPTFFDFDPLFRLDTVLALKDHELFSLVLIFLNDGLLEYQAWEKSHPGVLEKYRASRIYFVNNLGL